MTTALMAVIALATLQWVAFAIDWLARRKSAGVVWSTVGLAAVWLIVAHLNRAPLLIPTSVRSGCAGIHANMGEIDLKELLGQPTRVVSEAKTQGPDAEAWVYEDRRCVAHVLDGRVWSVDVE